MSSKEEILARIRQNTGTRYEKPDIRLLPLIAVEVPDAYRQLFLQSIQFYKFSMNGKKRLSMPLPVLCHWNLSNVPAIC